MKESEILKNVRELYTAKHATGYNGGHVSYGLCSLIMSYGLKNKISMARIHSIAHYIWTLMGSTCITLPDWLRKHGYITESEYEHIRYEWHTPLGKELAAKLFATRVAWLDWMIEQAEQREAIK